MIDSLKFGPPGTRHLLVRVPMTWVDPLNGIISSLDLIALVLSTPALFDRQSRRV